MSRRLEENRPCDHRRSKLNFSADTLSVHLASNSHRHSTLRCEVSSSALTNRYKGRNHEKSSRWFTGKDKEGQRSDRKWRRVTPTGWWNPSPTHDAARPTHFG